MASDGRGAGRQCFNIAFKWLECARALSSAAEGEIAEADLTDMREAFDYFDKDGTGFITKCELGAMMRMLGMNMSKTELQVTGLGDGERECGFYEANDTHRKRYRPMVLPHTKLGARLGSRNKSSVPFTLTSHAPRPWVQRIMDDIDADGNGLMDFSEFLQLSTRSKLINALERESPLDGLPTRNPLTQ